MASLLLAFRCLLVGVAALGASLAAAKAPDAPGRPGSWKVDTFIVLYMENRPFDHFFACMDLPGADNGAPRVLKGPGGATVNVTCGTAPYVCDGGTGYSTWAGKFAAGCGVDSPTASCNPNIYPYSEQSDEFSVANGATAGTTAVKMFSPEQIPVKAAIAKEFGVFNKFYSAGPTASTPNHLFTQAATSCGIADNILWNQCGGSKATFPPMTIYDNLYLGNRSFGFYINTTRPDTWEIVGGGWAEDKHGANYPDVMLDGVARHHRNSDGTSRFHTYRTFFEQAAAGTLPNFVWIAPNGTTMDHPCEDVAKGERLLKDIYEAVRSSPQWNRTMFAVVYDDAGGIYDHVVPPHKDVPADESPCNVGNPPEAGYSNDAPHPDGARLLNDEERQRALDGRWKGRTREGGAPIPTDGTTFALLNTFGGQANLVSFAYTDAPPGFKTGGNCGAGVPAPGQDCGDWLRTGYTKGSDGAPYEFHHILVEGAGPLTFQLRESFPAGKPTHRGWLTYATPRGPLPGPQDGFEFLHSNGTKEEAMIIEFKLTNQKQGDYSMVNLGKAGDMRNPATSPPSYISYHTVGNSHWVCSIDPKYPPWKAADAMTVELWKPGAPAPPAPSPTTPCAKRFDFRRLGLRTSAMLISPWIPKGTVIQEPKGPYNTSQFELTSVSATVKTLFNLSGFLTKRDAWAGSFDELLTLDAPRGDAPLHLPEAPKPAVPFPPNQGWPPGVPPTALQDAEVQSLAEDMPEVEPRHCSGNGQCAVRNGVTQKQRNTIAQFAAVSGLLPPPDLERMSHAAAADWITRAWHEHIEGGDDAALR